MFYQLLFALLFYSAVALNINTKANKKFCVNCQYYSLSKDANPLFAKCLAFPKNDENKIDFLVTGNKANLNFLYCSTARENDLTMCGKEGKNYRKKYRLHTKKEE